MTTLRRALLTTSLAVAASGAASANSIFYLSSPTTEGPTNTDFTYSLALPKFNLAGDTLTGATIYFFAQENINTLTLTNTASSAETFTIALTSNVVLNATNSANNADKFKNETLSLFSQTGITLGAAGSGACPESTPSGSCSTVAYTPPSLTVTNLSVASPTGTGTGGVQGAVKAITGGDLANYVGAGNFTLGGQTHSLESLGGGGANITAAIATTAQFSAEVDYTYTVPVTGGAPEPATLAMMGGGFLGLGWLFKRRRKNAKS